MKNILIGLVLGAVLTSGAGLAQEWLDEPMSRMPMVVVPLTPILPAPNYPPSTQSLPPMPMPHWQSPC